MTQPYRGGFGCVEEEVRSRSGIVYLSSIDIVLGDNVSASAHRSLASVELRSRYHIRFACELHLSRPG